VKVGDLIRLYDSLDGETFSVGLVCDIECVIKDDPDGADEWGAGEDRYWTVWGDGAYAWITEEDDLVVISESR